MKITVTCLLLFVFAVIALRADLKLEEYFPEKYSQLKKLLAENSNSKKSAIIIKFLGEIKNYDMSGLNLKKKTDIGLAYSELWGIAQNYWNTTKDEKEKSEIMNYWNTSLEEKSLFLPFQVLSLVKNSKSYANFSNKVLWNMFFVSKDIKFIAALSYVVSEKGTEKELEKLIIKQKSIHSEKEKIKNLEQSEKIVAKGISWTGFRLEKEQQGSNFSDPGPASAPLTIKNVIDCVFVSEIKSGDNKIKFTNLIKNNSKNKSDWTICLEMKDGNKRKAQFVKLGETVSDYHILDILPVQKKSEKDTEKYELKIEDVNTGEISIIR